MENYGDACEPSSYFATTPFYHHIRAASNSASESVHDRAERQSKQRAIRGHKVFVNNRAMHRHGKVTELGWFDNTIKHDPVYSISECARSYILCRKTVCLGSAALVSRARVSVIPG